MDKVLNGEVRNVVYFNPDNNYLVVRLKVAKEPGLVTVVGNLGQVFPGEQVEVRGQWKEHPRFGPQFLGVSCIQKMPATLNGIKRFLASGLMKGVGPALAGRMLKAFGEQVLQIIEDEPDRLLQVEGIGPKKLAQIKKSWQEQKEIRNLILFLHSHSVAPTHASKIFKHYGGESISVLKENPYTLAYEIRGVGFKTADKMALQLGFAQDHPLRLQAAITYQLFQFSEQGHVFAPREKLLEDVSQFVDGVSRERLEDALALLGEQKRVKIVSLPEQGVEQAVFLIHFFRWEREISDRLFNLASHPSGLDTQRLKQALDQEEKDLQIGLSTEQQQAILGACKHKVAVVTGGPGTGKTTITKVIVGLLRRLGLKVKLAAPTGRASKRLAEATGHGASTLHRLLGFQPGGGFGYHEEKKLSLDVLIIDEVSMLDCQLFLAVMRALPLTARLILIGDVHQLPAVGPGNVLADILDSQVVPSYELTRIYRQARQSMLVVNAHRINKGQFPIVSPQDPPQADFFWVEQEELSKVQELILGLVCERIPRVYGFDSQRDIQVLSPMHKGEVGTAVLNRLLQERLNPNGEPVKSGGQGFRVGDRVLQTRNNYEKAIFNGDLGWIKGVDQEEGIVVVDFDGQVVEYDLTEMDELTLAYAISVHKAQGSEYPAVVVPVVTQHFIMLRKNLVYTALTRARKLAVLIGSKRALAIALKDVNASARLTNLRFRLQEVFNQG